MDRKTEKRVHKSTGKSLIIVESPAKIKTLRKFLGPNYLFESSMGHIRDLPEKEFGIDLENDFEPTYTTMKDKGETINKLKKAAKQCDYVYLSSDPDREGEAIAWHISQILSPNTNIKRVSFNSITKDAVLKALETPRDIDLPLVDAYQARRVLDRLVGYKLSPYLNRRIQRGKEGWVSAGRVQSAALKLVVDREKEIDVFKPVEYWNIGAILKTKEEERHFRAHLYSVHQKKVEKEPIAGKEVYLIGDKAAADAVLELIKGETFKVEKVEKKEKKRHPVPPFITSTLQQEASRHFGFSSARTMSIAQGLYEGIDIGTGGPEGLITYMRTDSVRLVPEALDAAREYIKTIYGPNFIPAQVKVYATQKSTQDAHEAIRPTSLLYPPEKIQSFLTREQFLLYQLIWRRFLACQMMPAIYDTVSADLSAGADILMRATGSVIKFQGFLIVYEEKEDDSQVDEEGRMLPPLQENQLLQLIELTSDQAFTRPAPRYTEASLVKDLEKSGIGRPSTYAAIMNKIQSRDYTVKEGGRLKPTEIGRVILALLETNFQSIMNIGFTAAMEDDLELVAENRKDWKVLIRDFWKDFSPVLEIAEKEGFVPKILTDLDCPNCQAKLQKIWFKSKYFYGCSRYPDCNFSSPVEELSFNKEEYAADFNWAQPCPICQGEMKVRHGKFGAFLGCLNYPDCKGIVNIPKKGEVVINLKDMPPCPANECPGHMVSRKSRFGKTFYSCSTFPECNVIVNNLEDLKEKYPNHPRTPYIKKGKKGAAKKSTVKESSVKKVTKATKKTASSKTIATDSKQTKTPLTAKVTKPKIAQSKVASSKATKPKIAKPKVARNMPTVKLSAQLAAVVGQQEMPRTEVTKKLWEYIKLHGLQDEKNKRLIKPDAKLTALFGSPEPLDMFKMTAVVTKHME